jgi:hypothetical protein
MIRNINLIKAQQRQMQESLDVLVSAAGNRIHPKVKKIIPESLLSIKLRKVNGQQVCSNVKLDWFSRRKNCIFQVIS